MAQAKVYQNLVGKTTRGKFPAIQGAEWSCNMYREKSGEASYMASVPGFKLVRESDAELNAERKAKREAASGKADDAEEAGDAQ